MTGAVVDAGGWAGAAALLLAYGLVSAGRLDGRGIRFQLLNLFGAVGLLGNGIWHGAWPSAALNAVWLVIGVFTVVRLQGTASWNRPPRGPVPVPSSAQSTRPVPPGADGQPEKVQHEP